MRLIDADAIEEYIAKYPTYKGEPISEQTDEIIKCVIYTIKGMPTAYDVDKVVGELDLAEYPCSLFDVDNCEITESLLKTDMVENIIRRGGVDEN